VKVRFTPEALESIRCRNRWWREHRDHVDVFGTELRAVLARIRRDADAARQHYSGRGPEAVWRLLMPKTNHHVYYTRDDLTKIARVVLVDNAVSADGPDL
jgi:hypothetical protein